MTEDRFWEVIRQSRAHFDAARRDGNMTRQSGELKRLLAALPGGEVTEFVRIFDELFWRAYRWDLWGAAYIIGEGCSDDAFTDFRYWLISMGRDVYERALADPESLASVARANGVEDIFFEEFGYVGDSVLEERGEERFESVAARPDEPFGDQWTEGDLPGQFPKLWSLFSSGSKS